MKNNTHNPKKIAVLGSTGSIGTQALDIISDYPDRFQVEALVANTNTDLLTAQALKYNPNFVIIADESKYDIMYNNLINTDIKVFAGNSSINDIVSGDNIDIVIAAMVGFAGLIPVIEAIKAKKTIALANKETLVAAGEIINKLVVEYKNLIIPVDSEHSAIFQCLVGENFNKIEKIVLTASGGPFRGCSLEELANKKPADALKHPTWNMGNKISIDSATLMNKGLEMIEAHWLFDVAPENIEICIHPQSIIHSMICFEDSSFKAQLSLPDMKTPILYALSYPERLKTNMPRFDFNQIKNFSFEKPDMIAFPCLEIAYQAISKGGNIPCIMNAANECAVEAFMQNKLNFNQIPEVINKTIKSGTFCKEISLETIIESDNEARKIANSIITKI